MSKDEKKKAEKVEEVDASHVEEGKDEGCECGGQCGHEQEETGGSQGTKGTPLRQGFAGQAKGEECECDEKIAELENQTKRTLADYQNLQKRVQDERSSWIQSANKELLLRLLPVLDTLMLAGKHSQDKNLLVSVQLFLDTVKSEGVVIIVTEGKDFDPNTMECIATEAGKENKVLEELRAGYLLNERVLRPAQVKVGKKE